MKKILLSVLAVFFVLTPAVHAQEYGVYVKAVDKIKGTFDDAVKNTEAALKKNGWQILASYEAAVPGNCGFRAYNIVINSPEYAKEILSHGPMASFAIPLRVELYQDEKGLNSAFVNPASINRTILGDKTGKQLSESTMKKLSEILASAVHGDVVNRQIGELRTEGRVGGMGGGAFADMPEVMYKKDDAPGVFQNISAKVKEGILANKKGWKLVYTLEPAKDVVMFGVNNPATEARAYGIAGEKRESRDYRCPGIDHAAAFPIEVVIYKERGVVKVVTLDEMYRMKLYFEDAGNWAFMKNMRMPGQIKSEIVEISTSKLEK
jgi:uncharacterized protein (DUF302 family)